MTEPASPLEKRLSEAIASHDRDAALEIALEEVRSGRVAIPGLYDALTNLLVGVGQAWQRGETQVWQEHFATSVVRTIIDGCHPLVNAAAAAPIGRTVLLATPPEEYHDLGLRMISDRFELAGWTTHLLGASLPVAQLSLAVSALGADAVVLSASTHFHRVALRGYVQKLRSDHPALRIWVGGAAFEDGAPDWPPGSLLDPEAIPTLAQQVG